MTEELTLAEVTAKLNRIETVVSALATDRRAPPETPVPDDGRPMPTDMFLQLVMEQFDDDYDRNDAIRDWLEGDWDAAMQGIDTNRVQLNESSPDQSNIYSLVVDQELQFLWSKAQDLYLAMTDVYYYSSSADERIGGKPEAPTDRTALLHVLYELVHSLI